MKMSLSMRVALVVAVASLLITFLAGLSAQIRWLSLLQRIAVSVAFFTLIGYIAGKRLEIFLRGMIASPKRQYKGGSLDIKSQPPPENFESFDPFTADQFERIERK